MDSIISLINKIRNKVSKKQLFSFAILIILMLFFISIAYDRIMKIEGHEVYYTNEPIVGEVIISKDQQYSQSFFSPVDSLTNIHLFADVDVNDLPVDLELQIYDSTTGELLNSSILRIENPLVDNKLDFKLGKTTKEVNGKLLNINVSVKNASNENLKIKMITVDPYNNLKLTVISENTNFQKLFVVISIITFLLIIISYFSIFSLHKEIYKIFFVNALIFGIIMMLLIPIGSAPDEQVHMDTAYHYSNIMLGIKENKNNIHMRYDDANTSYQVHGINNDYMIRYLSNLQKPINNNQVIETNRGTLNVGLYSYTYLFSSLGLTVGRLLNLGTWQVYSLGRLFNLIFYSCIAAYSIKKTPVFKSLFVMVGLFPMTLQQCASFSYDCYIIAISFLIISLTLKLLYEEEVNKKDIILLAVSSISLSLCKQFAYVPVGLIPLVCLIKNTHFNWKKYQKLLIRISLTVFFIIIIGILFINIFNVEFTDNRFSLLYLITHIKYAFLVVKNTFFNSFYSFIVTAICCNLGWFQIPMHSLITLAYCMLLFYSFIKKGLNSDKIIPLYVRLLFATLSLISFVGIVYAMYSWTGGYFPGAVEALGVQGRYFIPLLIPFIIGISKKYYIVEDYDELKIYFVSIFLMFTSVIFLFIHLG